MDDTTLFRVVFYFLVIFMSRLTQAEKKAVEARYDDICGALELMMKGQFDTAMSRYNG